MHDNKLRAVLEQMPVGVTVIDLEGKILYYNQYSAHIVDRKPEYIGMDIRSCHKKSESIEKIDKILAAIKEGKMENFRYESKRQDKTLSVTVSPHKQFGKLIGFIQTFVVN